MMNYDNSIKARGDRVVKRYGKTTKVTAPRKAKPKLKIKPILGKTKIGIKGKLTF